MAFTSPKTWASGYIVLASDLNIYIRDNQNMTAPAVMSAQGDILIASGANTPIRLAKSTTSTQYLANTGTSNAPAWNEVALDTGVSATLPVGNGGTGQTSLTTGAILIGNSASAVTMVTQTTKGQILIGDGSGPPQMLGVGSNTQVLMADTGATTGVKWDAALSGGGSQASPSATKAETDEDTYVPPDLIKNSPGVAKVWCHITETGPLSTPDYGVSTVDDNGAGDRTINFSIEFSSVIYVPLATIETGASSNPTAHFAALDEASVQLLIMSGAGALEDRVSSQAIYGDQ